VATCPNFINDRTGRDAILFFHRPISGSTYQLFLFPKCDQSNEHFKDSLTLSGQLTEGVSFSFVSDDKQFQNILRTSNKVDLVTSVSTGWNFKHIYYSFIKVDILSDMREVKPHTKEIQMPLILKSGAEISLKYHFIPYFKLKVFK